MASLLKFIKEVMGIFSYFKYFKKSNKIGICTHGDISREVKRAFT